jgi:hypothetical protein
MSAFTPKVWLILAGVIVLLMFVSTIVAYFKGKRVGASTAPTAPQIAPKADTDVQAALAKAAQDVKIIEEEAKRKRDELDAVLAVKDEKARLAALADLANKWKLP